QRRVGTAAPENVVVTLEWLAALGALQCVNPHVVGGLRFLGQFLVIKTGTHLPYAVAAPLQQTGGSLLRGIIQLVVIALVTKAGFPLRTEVELLVKLLIEPGVQSQRLGR